MNDRKKQPKKVGRPKLPKGEAKGSIVAVRFSSDEIRAIAAMAVAQHETVSEWIRRTLLAELGR